MRLLLVACACAPGLAHADDRLDLDPIPELRVLGGFPIGRSGHAGLDHAIAAGVGRAGDDRGPVVAGQVAAGASERRWIVGASSELATLGRELLRGQHRSLVELRTLHHSERASSLALATAIDHGLARGLAPVRRGAGHRASADVAGEALLQIGPEQDDFIFVGEVLGELGGTRWRDAPTLDRETHRAIGLGFGRAPTDGELPRGTVDFLRGRVEHATIRRTLSAAGAGASAASDAEVRTVELALGTRELTFHVDHELLAVFTGQLGWRWLEADSDAGRLADSMLYMRWGGAIATRVERNARQPRRFGVGVSREPTFTPDGQRLVSEWRLAVDFGVDEQRYVATASGGISWAIPTAGDSPQDERLVRYGSHVESFYKLGGGLELGAYHATTYEPALAGNPWAAPRRWATEAGALLRFRGCAH